MQGSCVSIRACWRDLSWRPRGWTTSAHFYCTETGVTAAYAVLSKGEFELTARFDHDRQTRCAIGQDQRSMFCAYRSKSLTWPEKRNVTWRPRCAVSGTSPSCETVYDQLVHLSGKHTFHIWLWSMRHCNIHHAVYLLDVVGMPCGLLTVSV